MDSKQKWFVSYFGLNDVHQFIRTKSDAEFRQSKIHELYVTWVVARFLQWQKKSEHLIGFPLSQSCQNLPLPDLLNSSLIINNENFDTVIVDRRYPEVPAMVQIKRYMRVSDPNTDRFFEWLCKMVDLKYNRAPEVSLVVDLQQDLKLNLQRLADLLKGREFGVGSITALCYTRQKEKVFLFSIYPRFSGELWYPAP